MAPSTNKSGMSEGEKGSVAVHREKEGAEGVGERGQVTWALWKHMEEEVRVAHPF